MNDKRKAAIVNEQLIVLMDWLHDSDNKETAALRAFAAEYIGSLEGELLELRAFRAGIRRYVGFPYSEADGIRYKIMRSEWVAPPQLRALEAENEQLVKENAKLREDAVEEMMATFTASGRHLLARDLDRALRVAEQVARSRRQVRPRGEGTSAESGKIENED